MSVSLSTQGLRGPDKKRSVSPAAVQKKAERMLHALDLQSAELSILLCDDETIHVLNRDYRDKDRPTDVLAFAMEEGEGVAHPEFRILGDVVISIDTARRQAAEAKRSIMAEVTMLLAHGLLHLLGFDHQTEAEMRVMLARTDALVAASQKESSK